MIASPPYSILILLGGLGKRFGSEKSCFNYNGESLLSRRLVDLVELSPGLQSIVLSIRNMDQIPLLEQALDPRWIISKTSPILWAIRDKNTGQSLEIRIIPDMPSEVRAPSIGLLSVFSQCPDTIFQILPIDTPNISASYIRTIHQYVFGDGQMHYDAIIPQWSNGFLEPLHGIYFSTAFVETLKVQISQNIFRLKDMFSDQKRILYWNIDRFLQEMKVREKIFHNINSPVDL